MKQIWSQSWFKLLIVFLAWICLIFLASFFITQDKILPFEPSYSSTNLPTQYHLPAFIHRFAGFDGVHYLTIIENGYIGTGGIQAFFPLFPTIIMILKVLLPNPLLLGLIFSLVCFYAFLLLSFNYIKSKFTPRLAWWWVVFYLVFPVSFFFVGFYSESLFLLLLMATFYAYDRQQYWLVALFSILLSATRIIGILAPAAIILDLLIKAFTQKKLRDAQVWRQIGIVSLGSLGLFAYMSYLWFNFQDPLYFMTVQSSFGSGRQTSQLVILPQVFYRYAKMFVVGLPFDFKTFAIVQELVLSLAYLVGLVAVLWRNLKAKREIYPWAWVFFSLGAYLVPTLTGNFSSMPRYVIPCLAVNFLFVKVLARHPRLGIPIYLLSFFLMIFNLLLFLQGYWVA